MNNFKNPTGKELKVLIKEAILNEDIKLLESLLGGDKELLQEVFPLLAILGGLLTVGTTVYASDALGVTDNWYDKAVKYIDPSHYAISAFSGKNNPMFGESPDRMKSGWLSKGIGNLASGENFGKGFETENKSEIMKRAESGDITVRDQAQILFDAMDGAGSGVDEVKGILKIDPNIKPGTQEHLIMMGTWDEIYKEFDNVTKAEDNGDQDKDLIWWLDDEGDFPEEHKLMKTAVHGLSSPEKLRKAYPGVFGEGEEGSEEEEVEGDTAAAFGGGPKAGVTSSMGGHAILAGAAGALADAEDKIWQTYQTLKTTPASERSDGENELLDIFTAADK
jgi:hypothetical protein